MSRTAALDTTPHTDRTGAKIGMWMFLFSEILLFSGLFLLYAVARFKYAADFHYAAAELNLVMGAVNTIVLLTSSLTVVLSITALENGNKKLAVIMLIITLILAGVFLVNKYHEWGYKFEHGIYPGSDALANRSPGEQYFYGLYFVMTGLHAVHVLAGMIILAVILYIVMQNPYKKMEISAHQIRHAGAGTLGILDENGEMIWEGDTLDSSVRHVSMAIYYDDHRTDRINHSDIIKLENGGLYWHLVDIIWIFLFPLFLSNHVRAQAMNSTQSSHPGYAYYVFIWLGLVILTCLTVAVAGVNLRILAVVVALSVASIKSYLVISYFMHIKYDDIMFKRMIIFMISILAVILLLTYSDVLFR